MHPSRLIAGLLTVSFGMGILMISSFHGQRGLELQKDHSVAHVDSTVTDNAADALAATGAESSCHVNAQEAAIAQASGQSIFSVQLGAPVPTKIFVSGNNRILSHSSAFIGRNPPLFEHASLYAATVSMRI